MSDPLESPRLTVEHAKGHINEIETIVKSFFESKPYAVFTKPDPLYPGYQIEYVKIVKPLPARIPGLALDAVKNLRSALDQLGYAIAIADGKSGKHAHFPFGDTAADVETRRGHRSKHIRKEIFDVMAAFKPYPGGNNALWRLNKLSNVSKHEDFVHAVLFTSEITYDGNGIVLVTDAPSTGTEDEIPIGWIKDGAFRPYDKLKLAVSIRFNNIGNLSFKQPAITLLREFVRITDGIILGVEAEARRIGLFN